MARGLKQYHSKSMAVNTGIMGSMDYHIGAEASDPIAVFKIIPIWMKKVGYRQNIEDLGERESYNYIGPSFSSAAVGPLGHYKF
jgi:hypothetical protein